MLFLLTPALALAAALSLPPQAPASIDPEVVSVQRLIEEGDLQGALTVLDRALRRLQADPARRGDLALAHLWTGAVYVLLNQPQAARGHFREAVRTQPPGPRFLAGTVPPKVIAAFSEVLRQMQVEGALPAEVQAPASIAPGVLLPLSPSDCCPEVFLPPGTRQVVVAASGAADFRSIGEALRSAASVRVLLRPGLYRESLVIDRPVAIVGDGPLDAIVVEATAGNVVTMQTREALIQGVTLRGRTAPGRFFAVEAREGSLSLKGCDLSTDSLSALIVRAGVRVQVESSRLHDTPEAGVLVEAGGGVALEDSEIRGHRMIGVIVRSGGAATLRRCVITANRAFGIDVAAMGTATIENCDLKGNRVGAIKTWRGSKVQKSGNRE